MAFLVSPSSPNKLPMAAFPSSPSFSRSASFPSSIAPLRASPPTLSHNPLTTLIERRSRKIHVSAFHSQTSSDPHTFHDTSSPSRTRPPSTLYDVLDIAQTASQSDIKTAYRRLARTFHPDVVPPQEKEASTKLFLQIHAAYVALSNAQSRARYDLQLSIQAFQATGYKARSPRGGGEVRKASPIRTAPSHYTSRGPFSTGKGRSWETDQCWC